jgi:hypothetical protein
MSQKVVICDNLLSENQENLSKNQGNLLENQGNLLENDKNTFTKDEENLTKKHSKLACLGLIIDDIMSSLPEFLRGNDLIRIGLFKSRSDLCWAMKRNQAPPFIKLSIKKIVYPKSSLCEWLKQKSSSDDLNQEVENARP